MFHSNIKIIIFILTLIFSSIICCKIQAQETVTTVVKKTIITPIPKSINCTTIPAHWEGDIWLDTQSVCAYENRAEGVAWVQDYWACTTYSATTGECTSWQYKPGYWLKTMPQQ